MYQCKDSDFSSANEEELREHIKVYHTVIMLKCDHCDFNTTTQSLLRGHMIRAHPHKENSLQSGLVFNDRGTLRAHVASSHRNTDTRHGLTNPRYCYFYNNGGKCRNTRDTCKFLHESAPPCKFQTHCRRQKCAFSHEQTNSFLRTGKSTYLQPTSQIRKDILAPSLSSH